MTTSINGEARDTLSVTDRGLNYGDGLFETMRVHAGTIRLLPLHMKRLKHGCQRLGIARPAEIASAIQRAADEQRDGIVKVIVTRGSSGRGYRASSDMKANCIMTTSSLLEPPNSLKQSGGIRVGIAETRLASQPKLAGLKHLNRLEQVLAANEAGDFDERLMLDMKDRVIEGTMTNVFMVSGGILMTPDLSRAGVEGVMKQWIMKMSNQQGLACEVRDIPLSMLEQADEIFVCNAVRGIWPVVAVNEQPFPIGPVTRTLEKTLTELWP